MEEFVQKLSQFSYFHSWTFETMREMYKISKIKQFALGEIVLSSSADNTKYLWTSFVFFIVEGQCQVIECLNVTKKGQLDKSVPRKHFVAVCTYNKCSCFNLGENLKNRDVVAQYATECILVPLYWLMNHNNENIWVRIQHFLDAKIPNSKLVAEILVEDKKWKDYKKRLVKKSLRRKISTCTTRNVLRTYVDD